MLVNQTWKGKTPFTLRFKHYGVYDILLTAPGYYPLHVQEPIRGPGYEKCGVDFVSEVLVPARIQDKRDLHYKLEKIEKEDKIKDILARDAKLRDKSCRIAEAREARDRKRRHLTLPLRTKEEEKKERDRKKEGERRKEKDKQAGGTPAGGREGKGTDANVAGGAGPDSGRAAQGGKAGKKVKRDGNAAAAGDAPPPELDNP